MKMRWLDMLFGAAHALPVGEDASRSRTSAVTTIERALSLRCLVAAIAMALAIVAGAASTGALPPIHRKDECRGVLKG